MSKIRFVHVRSTKGGCPVGTIAIRTFGGKMSVGWAIQNPSDPWNRSLGRDIAAGRAAKSKIVVEDAGPGAKHEDMVIAAANCILAVDGTANGRELFGEFGLPRKFRRALVETQLRAIAAKAKRGQGGQIGSAAVTVDAYTSESGFLDLPDGAF